MSVIAAAVKHMLAAGMDHAAIVAAVAEMEAAAPKDPQAERRRERDRERKRLRNSAESAETLSPKKEKSPTPPKEKTTPIPVPSAESARDREFDQFWAIFPNRVGKRDASTAFAKARSRADLDTILDGVRRYAAKTDDRPWCNPATFLNQDRWADDPASTMPRPRAAGPPRLQTIGEMFREEARQAGLIDDDPPHQDPGRMDPRDGDRPAGRPGIARQFALPANVLGRLG